MDGCDFCGKEDLLGYECYVVCKECSDKYTNRASKDEINTAVALWLEYLKAITNGFGAQWFHDNFERVDAVIAGRSSPQA